MEFLKRIKIFLKRVGCPHRRPAFIIKSRPYEQKVKEVKVDFWQDLLIGLICQDCLMEIKATPVILNRYPYAGEPRYPIFEMKGEEENGNN